MPIESFKKVFGEADEVIEKKRAAYPGHVQGILV